MRTTTTTNSKNKFEKVKIEKCGSAMWTEAHELAARLRCALAHA